MALLDPRQRELIFDCCLLQCSPSEVAEAESLASRSEAARELRARIEAALSPLSSMSMELCPNHLADITVQRLCQVAREEMHPEQAEPRVIQVGLHRHVLRRPTVVAVAACLAVAAGAFFLISRPSMPQQYTERTLQRNIVHPFEVSGRSGYDLRPVSIIDENEGSTMPAGIPWPSQADPCRPYWFLNPGLEIVPPSQGEVPQYMAPKRRVQPTPVSTPSQRK